MSKVNLNEIQAGDVFSEEVHYKFIQQVGDTYEFLHLSSGNTVKLSSKYVEDLLTTADQYSQEVVVGKEDKLWTSKQILDAKKKGELSQDSNVREGDIRVPGIRSIWSNIHSSKVFMVCFNKQSKELSNKAFNELKTKQLEEAVKLIEAAQKGKTGVANKAKEVIEQIQNNPITNVVKGEERILRGYKIQFSSINGYYDVIDMDITSVKPGDNRRQVNVNAINWLVLDGVKYIVQ